VRFDNENASVFAKCSADVSDQEEYEMVHHRISVSFPRNPRGAASYSENGGEDETAPTRFHESTHSKPKSTTISGASQIRPEIERGDSRFRGENPEIGGEAPNTRSVQCWSSKRARVPEDPRPRPEMERGDSRFRGGNPEIGGEAPETRSVPCWSSRRARIPEDPQSCQIIRDAHLQYPSEEPDCDIPRDAYDHMKTYEFFSQAIFLIFRVRNNKTHKSGMRKVPKKSVFSSELWEMMPITSLFPLKKILIPDFCVSV